MKPETASRSQRYLALADAFLPPKAGSAMDLVLAYTRLFLGPGRPAAHLFESVYMEGRIMGTASLRVADRYAEAGLQMLTADNDMPDHISIELAFMANLAAREEQNQDQPEKWRDQQRRFINEHLGRWVPLFVNRIEESRAHPYYLEAALATEKMIAEETQRLNHSSIEIGRHEFRQAQSQPQRQIAAPEKSVRKRSQQYPNIYLEINTSNCTLCTLCTDICQTGALSVARSRRRLSLIFDPKSCNGCRACYRLCPEQAVSIIRGPALTAPTTRCRKVVAKAERVFCPSCQNPHISTAWLARLVERSDGDDTLRQSLSYCPYCKASPTTGPLVPQRPPEESFDNA